MRHSWQVKIFLPREEVFFHQDRKSSGGRRGAAKKTSLHWNRVAATWPLASLPLASFVSVERAVTLIFPAKMADLKTGFKQNFRVSTRVRDSMVELVSRLTANKAYIVRRSGILIEPFSYSNQIKISILSFRTFARGKNNNC